MTEVKHKSGRSVDRMFGETIEVNAQTGETKITGRPIEVRFAYPFLHELRTKSAGGMALLRPRNDITVLIPKLGQGGDCPHWKLLASMQMEAAVAAWGSWPAGYNPNIQDGDVPHRPKPKPGAAPISEEQILAKNEWRKGFWVIEASVAPNSVANVFVFDAAGQRKLITPADPWRELYKSGDYGYLYLNAWTFQKEANFGINFGTDGVLFSRTGDRIGGAGGQRSPGSMFGSLVSSPAAPAPSMAPAPQYAQPQPAPQYAPPPSPMPGAPTNAAAYSPAPVPAAPIPPAAPSPTTTYPSSAPAPQYSAPPMPPAAPGLPPFPGR